MPFLRHSPDCTNLVKSFESCVLTSYWDPDGRVWTIGWGSTGKDVYQGLTWTQTQADTRIEQSLTAFDTTVRLDLGQVPVTQPMFDAVVSAVYNIGPGPGPGRTGRDGLIWLGNGTHSTFWRLLLRRDYLGASEELPKWCHAGGRVLPGLVRRREAERVLFLSGGTNT